MTAAAQSMLLKTMPARMAGVVNTAAMAVAATRATHRWRSRLVISAPLAAAGCRHPSFGARVAYGWPDAGRVSSQEQHALHALWGLHRVETPEGERADTARPPRRLILAQHGPAHRDGHGSCSSFAVGLLHVLAASPSGGGAGSRAFRGEEVPPQGAGSMRLAWGLLRRALDADPPAETLPAGREGAHPTRAAAA